MPISFINKKNNSSSINKNLSSASGMKKFIKQISLICTLVFLSVFFYSARTRHPVEIIPVMAVPVTNKVIILDAGHGTPDERNSLLTLKNNIDLLQKIKCFKHFIFFMLKRRLIYAKQRIW